MTRLRGLLILSLAALCCGAASDDSRNARPGPAPDFDPPPDALFADAFQDSLGAWHPDREGVWSIRYGALRADLPDRKQEHSLIYAGDSAWTDYAIDFDVCGMRGVDKGVVARTEGGRGLGVDLRGPGYHDVKLHVNEIPVASADINNPNGVWHHVRLEVRDRRCRLFVDGERLIDRKVLGLPARGRIALAAYTGGIGECTVYYDNVVVTPLK